MAPPIAPALSVVIPAYNAASTLGEQLDALRQQRPTVPVEIVVVDNGSTDSTELVVHGRAVGYDRIRLVSEPRKGAAAALNRGISEARADWMAFCDADDVVSDGWVDAALRGLASHEIVTGPRRVDEPETNWARYIVEMFANVTSGEET